MNGNSAAANRSKIGLIVLAVALATTAIIVWPTQAWIMARFIALSLLSVAPVVVPGIVLTAWVMASGADAHIARAFEGRLFPTVIVASAIGAITPVCGITILPLMAGLLAAGIPLAPVMAFWLASPITDPAMLATTVATLGVSFAVGKTLAAFGLGLWGGFITSVFSSSPWVTTPLRNNKLVCSIQQYQISEQTPFTARIWSDASRRASFKRNFIATTRLILICLIPAFAAEYALNAVLPAQALSAFVGEDVWWAIPFAVFVGAPAYLDGYAALPLTRGLMEHGMSSGAAMAFLVSGGVVSIWGALAILPILKLKTFFLYLALAVSGSLIAGYVFDLVS